MKAANVYRVMLLCSGVAVLSARADAAEPAQTVVVDRIAATVGEEVITRYEVEQRLASLKNPVAEMVSGGSPEERAGYQTVLDGLIAERLILAEARTLAISVSDADVDEHLKGIMTQNGWSAGDFATVIQMLGFADEASYREHARRELLKGQTLRIKVGSKARVTDREVEEAFNQAFEGGKSEEQIHLWHIVFRIPESATLTELKALLAKAGEVRALAAAGGTSFEELAKKYGEDATSARGGDVGYFGRGRLQGSIEDAAFALKDGEVSEVVQSSAGFHILRVTDRRRAPIGDVEEARARVRYELTEQAWQKAYEGYIRDLRANARVEVRTP